jgi:hypothetical protein
MLINPKARATMRAEVPGEPGQWIDIQRLAFSELPARLDVDRVLGLFKKAIVAWSYPESIADHVAFLDDGTAAWLLGKIDEFNHPNRTETDLGNATARSTPSLTET